MQRNYPRMFSLADDQDKDGFNITNKQWVHCVRGTRTHPNFVPISGA